MRSTMTGLVLAFALAGAARASEFIVVNTSDGSIKAGQAFDAGARVALGAGKTLTVMRASGAVTTLTGGPNGVVLPGAAGAADNARFDAVRALFEPPPSGRAFGARRGGLCPAPEALTTLDAIVEANKGTCKAQAKAAFQAYLKKQGAPGADAIYSAP